MTETTRTWPLVVAAALALLTATTAATPRGETVPAHPALPETWSCHYHDGSIERHCELLP
jgi:hypothetical protein